jgi:hypothetical protein
MTAAELQARSRLHLAVRSRRRDGIASVWLTDAIRRQLAPDLFVYELEPTAD